MSIAISIVDGERAHDVRLSADVPIATLLDDLERLTGHASLVLSSALGEPLDHNLSLRANGMYDGAILQAESDRRGPEVYDDIVDLIPPPAAPRALDGAPLVCLATALAALVGGLSHPAAAHLTEAAAVLSVLATGAGPRLGLRITRLHPRVPAAADDSHRRAAAATQVTRALSQSISAITVIAGIALTLRADRYSILAGWGCLALVISRTLGRDPSLLTIASFGVFVGLVGGMPRGQAPVVVAGAAATCLLAWAASPNAAPAARLAAERLGVLLTVVIPPAVVCGSGLLPGVP